MKYLAGLLLGIGAFAQSSNPIVDYLKLTPPQLAAMSTNIRSLAPDLSAAVSRGSSLIQGIQSGLAKEEIDSLTLGSLYSQFELNCRDIQAAAARLYTKNLTLLTPDQNAKLDALLAKERDQALIADASAANLFNVKPGPSFLNNVYGYVVDPTLELATYLEMSSSQLDRLRALDALDLKEVRRLWNRVQVLQEIIDIELTQDAPAVAPIGEADAEIALRNRDLAATVTSSIQNNRAVLTVAQRAKIDSLSPSSTIGPLAQRASVLYLTPVAHEVPASIGVPATGLSGLLASYELRDCQYPNITVLPSISLNSRGRAR